MLGRSRESKSIQGASGIESGISAGGEKNVESDNELTMEKARINELIGKYNEGLADPAEVKQLEQLIESGEVELTQLENLDKLENSLASMDLGNPSMGLDDRFYAMLAAEKKKSANWSFEMPTWSSLLPRLAFASLFTLLGVAGSYLFFGRSATPEVQQLTQQVGELKEMMMLSLLEKESATERLRAVSLTSEMNTVSTNVTQALIQTLNNDENVNVRLAALDALRAYVGDTAVRVALIQSIGQQSSPLVQVALAELMAAIQEKKSIKEFEKILEGDGVPEDVKKRIKENLKVIV